MKKPVGLFFTDRESKLLKNRISRIKKNYLTSSFLKMFTTEVKDKLAVMTRMAYKPITSHWSREDSLSPFS